MPATSWGSTWRASDPRWPPLSFVTFALGAAIPCSPTYWHPGSPPWLRASLSLATLFLVGAATGVLAGRPWWMGGLCMLLIGVGAASVTFAIGSAVGVTVS